MKKIFFVSISVLPVLCGILSCGKLSDFGKESDIEARIEMLEGELSRVATVEEQVKNIQNSVSALYEVDDLVSIRIEDLKVTTTNLLTDLVEVREKYEGDEYTEQGRRIDALKTDMETLRSNVVSMQNTENGFRAQIDKLDAFQKDSCARKDWMETTFMTLEKQKEIGNTVGTLKTEMTKVETNMETLSQHLTELRKKMDDGDKALIDRIDALKADLEAFDNDFRVTVGNKITESENSIRAWVSDTLSRYYDAGEMDAELTALDNALKDSLSNADEVHRVALEGIENLVTGFRRALKASLIELQDAYEAAVKSVADSLNGLILCNMDSIAKANGGILSLRKDITDMETALTSMKTDVSDLEGQIQSVAFVPSDPCGAAAAWYVGPLYKFEDLRLDYQVFPADKAATLSAGNVKVYLKSVNIFKGSGDGISEVEFKDFSTTADGIVSVTIEGGKIPIAKSELDSKSICVRLAIETGTTVIGSGFTDVYAKDRTPEGALRGLFSIASNRQVFFAKGNLQAAVDDSGKPGQWSFASRQYEYIGEAVADTTIGRRAGKVDLFGWSTNDKYGISASVAAADYSGSFKDWGKAYDSTGVTGWRTVSGGNSSELEYLVTGRTDARKKIGYATIKDGGSVVATGLVLLPDTDWVVPDCGFSEIGVSPSWADNTYSVSDWNNKMEPAGAVFLPAAGQRSGYSVSGVGNYGWYWTGATGVPDHSDRSYVLTFEGTSNLPGNRSEERRKGCSVRLVVDYLK